MWIELYGYLGSALVVISMLMSSVVKLRVINTIGSVISGSYALIIGSFPLALMNICLIVINLYGLKKLLMNKQQYHLVKCGSDDSSLAFFLEQYGADIRKYFDLPQEKAAASYLIFCNTAPAGVLLGSWAGDGRLQILVEYTTPAYRDCSIGKFLYAALPGEGVRVLQMDACKPSHEQYLHKMGYTQENGVYTKTL